MSMYIDSPELICTIRLEDVGSKRLPIVGFGFDMGVLSLHYEGDKTITYGGEIVSVHLNQLIFKTAELDSFVEIMW